MRRNILLSVLLIGFLLLAALLWPSPRVSAADIRTGDHVIVAADEIIDDDLIISANLIEIDGTITGDLIATGSQIVVRGAVGGSAALAAQSIDVAGQIDGSLYAAGYAMRLLDGAAVGRNLFFGGFSLLTHPQSTVERAAHVTGSQMTHNGTIGGDLTVSLGGLDVNGAVGGDLNGQTAPSGTAAPQMPFAVPGLPAVTMLAPGLRVAPEAQIGGEIVAREVVPTPPPTTGFLGLPIWLLNRIGETIGLLLTALVIIAMAPRFIPALSDALRRQPLPSLGWGLLVYLVLFPLGLIGGLILVVLLAIIVNLITFGRYTAAILGLSAGFWVFALFLFLFFVYMVAWLVVGHLVGRGLLSRLGGPTPGRGMQFLYVVVGVILFQLLRAVPILGFILAFIVGTLALGALFVAWLERRRTIAAGKTALPA